MTTFPDVEFSISDRKFWYNEQWRANPPLTFNRHATMAERITIEFSYPLAGKYPIVFQRSGGFTLSDLCNAVADGYDLIYKDEASVAKYGVWGHGICDLILEGISSTDTVHFTIHMGS